MRPNAVAWLLAISAVVATSGSAFAQADTTHTAPLPPPPSVTGTEPDFPRGRISGLVFGDLYYNLSGDPTHNYSLAGADSTGKAYIDGNGVPITKDLNGVQIRRVYFQLDNDLSVKVASRFRLEVDSNELTSGGKLGVFVKAAYLQIKDVVPRGSFTFGMSNTPTFENSEEFWGYRSVEKTIVDFRGLSSSTDLGVQLKGFADGNHKIGYNAMIGDGTGQRPENNRYKRGYFALPLRLMEDLRIEPYVDYEARPGETDRALYKIFTGYELKRGAIGLEAFQAVNHVAGGRNLKPTGISVFGRTAFTEKVRGFVRFDRFQPNTLAANRLDTDLYIAGLDFEPYKDVRIQPNIEMTDYNPRGTQVAPPHHDLQARLTFYWKFSKP
jgi:hypothetical protein